MVKKTRSKTVRSTEPNSKIKPSPRESFQTLQGYLKDGEVARLAFKVFDIFYMDHYSLIHLEQNVRRQILNALFLEINQDNENPVISVSEEFEWTEKLLDRLCDEGHEGVILKHKHSPYQQSRSQNWLKLKCGHREEYVVIGWTEPQGHRDFFGALLLAEEIDGELHYRGKVGTGFDDQKLSSIFKKISKLKIKECPAKNCDEKSAHFIKPNFFAEIRYTEKSREKKLRHPVFLGLRADKFYEAKKLNSKPKKSQGLKSNVKIEKMNIGNEKSQQNTYETSVILSNPERVFYEEIKLTKKDLLDYYHLVFPEFKKMGLRRPLSYLRCPRGKSKTCFFQKHVDPDDGHPLQTKIKTSSGKKPYSYFDSFDDLASMVQLGALEFHAWNCAIHDTDRPQYVVWDIDPGPGVKFSSVTLTAHIIRLILKQHGLESFVRTTGGKGLHVLSHVEGMGWAEAKKFSLNIAKILVDSKPDMYLTNSSLKLRKNKIFIDYLRNSKSATSVLNYSTRAREGAPVAVPLFWNEVHENLNPQIFSIPEVIKRVKTQKVDPWKDFYAKLG